MTKTSHLTMFAVALASGCTVGSIVNGGADAGAESETDGSLTPAESSLVGTWRREVPSTATGSVVSTLELRADHTSTLTIEDVRTCGVAWSLTLNRAWQASDSSLTIAPTPTCMQTRSSTCIDNDFPPFCTGPRAGGMYSFAIAGTSLTVTGVETAMADDGTWMRR